MTGDFDHFRSFGIKSEARYGFSTKFCTYIIFKISKKFLPNSEGSTLSIIENLYNFTRYSSTSKNYTTRLDDCWELKFSISQSPACSRFPAIFKSLIVCDILEWHDPYEKYDHRFRQGNSLHFASSFIFPVKRFTETPWRFGYIIFI